MLVIYRKGLCQIHIFNNKSQFRICEENVIRSTPACDIVTGKRRDKTVRLFYRQNPAKESVKGEPPCVLCITVQSHNEAHDWMWTHHRLLSQSGNDQTNNYDLNHWSAQSTMPKQHERPCKRIWWSTVSKAAEISLAQRQTALHCELVFLL